MTAKHPAPLLTEETHSLLHRLLDKADEGRIRWQLRCSVRETPELYEFSDPHQVDAVLEDLRELAKLGVLELDFKSRQKPGHNEYDDGWVKLKYEAEERVRHWLNRPAFDPRQHLWNTALAPYESQYEDGGLALKREVLSFPGRNYEQVAKAFASMPELVTQPMTLRQISAKCFWGASKFLDRRESLLLNTFPSLSVQLKARPLLLSAYLPTQLNAILFIENQDSFLGLVQRAPKTTGLIYSAGFKVTATRVREPGQTVFSYVNRVEPALLEHFQAFWLGQQPLPCYFWGDLDFAGMAILAALKQVFPGVEAWAPGYGPMLHYLQAGKGHSAMGGSKEKQYHPGVTACNYSDYVLIPAMETELAFVDQETIDLNQLEWEL